MIALTFVGRCAGCGLSLLRFCRALLLGEVLVAVGVDSLVAAASGDLAV